MTDTFKVNAGIKKIGIYAAAIIGLMAGFAGIYADSGIKDWLLGGGEASPSERIISVIVEKNKEISGRIINGDVPSVDMEIILYDAIGQVESTSTNLKGEFLFSDLKYGNYYIQFSNKTGVAAVPVELSINKSNRHVPIQLNGLIRVTFNFPLKTPSFSLYVDGRPLLVKLLKLADFSKSPVGIHLDMRGKQYKIVLFLVPGIHTYKVDEIKVDDNKRVVNPYITDAKKKEDYITINEIETLEKKFVANEDIFLFKSVTLSPELTMLPKPESSSIRFTFKLSSYGYLGKRFIVKVNSRRLGNGKFSGKKTIEQGLYIEGNKITNEIPYEIKDFDDIRVVSLLVTSEEGGIIVPEKNIIILRGGFTNSEEVVYKAVFGMPDYKVLDAVGNLERIRSNNTSTYSGQDNT